ALRPPPEARRRPPAPADRQRHRGPDEGPLPRFSPAGLAARPRGRRSRAVGSRGDDGDRLSRDLDDHEDQQEGDRLPHGVVHLRDREGGAVLPGARRLPLIAAALLSAALAATPGSGTIVVFTQDGSLAARDFERSTLPRLRALAEQRGLALEVRQAAAGA